MVKNVGALWLHILKPIVLYGLISVQHNSRLGSPEGSRIIRHAGIDYTACRYSLFPNREIFSPYEGTYV